MFIFWSLSSGSFFFVSLLVFFFFSNTFFFTWVGLELMTWAMFFFFSLYWNKNSQEILFIFFFIQSLSSILWLISSFLKENMVVVFCEGFLSLKHSSYWVSISLTEILIIVSLFLKMGLFSGHIWMWQLYSMKMTYPVVLISTLQKIYPMMMVVWFFQEYKNNHLSFFYFLLLSSILIVSTKSWKGFSVFYFLFLSSILQYSMVLLCSFISFFEMGGIFMMSYWFLFVLTIFLLKEFKLESEMSGQGGNSFLSKSKSEILFISLSLSGFPPTMVFFMKFFLLMKMSFFTISILGLLVLMSIFLYTSFIIFNVTKILIQFKSLSGSEFFLQEKNKNSNQEGFFFYSLWFYLSNFFVLLLM